MCYIFGRVKVVPYVLWSSSHFKPMEPLVRAERSYVPRQHFSAVVVLVFDDKAHFWEEEEGGNRFVEFIYMRRYHFQLFDPVKPIKFPCCTGRVSSVFLTNCFTVCAGIFSVLIVLFPYLVQVVCGDIVPHGGVVIVSECKAGIILVAE